MVTTLPKYLFFLLVCLYSTACRKERRIVYYLDTDKTTLNTTAAAGHEYLQIRANTSWQFSDLPGWIKATPVTGKKDTRVQLEFTANTGTSPRSATVTLSGEKVKNSTITITQLGEKPTLLADQSSLSPAGEGQEDSILVTSNLAWQLTIPADAPWITADKLQGQPGQTKVKFIVEPSDEARERKATLALKSTGNQVTPISIEVKQAQKLIDVKIESLTKSAAGGEVIEIHGEGFSLTPTANIVTINGKNATVKEATAHLLQVLVPCRAGDGDVLVAVGRRSAKGPVPFSYLWKCEVSNWAGDEQGTVFSFPKGLAVDPLSNVYVADYSNHRIRKVTNNPDGTTTVTTFAGSDAGETGSKDEQGTNARFFYPESVSLDTKGNLYVTDGNYNLRKITPNATVSTIKDKTGKAVRSMAKSIIADETENLYYTDPVFNTIKKISGMGEITQVLIGDPWLLSYPWTIAFSKDSKTLFASDYERNAIRQINLNNDGNAAISNLAGSSDGLSGREDGQGSKARYYKPTSIAIDDKENIYVADTYNHQIRKIVHHSDGTVETVTIAGTGRPGAENGPAEKASFNYPTGIGVSKDGLTIYVSDYNNHSIRKIAYN